MTRDSFLFFSSELQNIYFYVDILWSICPQGVKLCAWAFVYVSCLPNLAVVMRCDLAHAVWPRGHDAVLLDLHWAAMPRAGTQRTAACPPIITASGRRVIRSPRDARLPRSRSRFTAHAPRAASWWSRAHVRDVTHQLVKSTQWRASANSPQPWKR